MADRDVRAHVRAVFSTRQHPLAWMAVSVVLSQMVLHLYARAVSHHVLIETYVAFFLANGLIITVSLWRIFGKGGLPAWGAVVPFYNLSLLYQLVGRSRRSSALLLIPLLNVYLFIRLMNELSRSFGADGIFTVFLFVSPFTAFPMLAFGPASYLPLDAGKL